MRRPLLDRPAAPPPHPQRARLQPRLTPPPFLGRSLLPLLRPNARVVIVGSSAGKLARFSPAIQQRAAQCRAFKDVDALAQDFVQGVDKGDFAARGWPETCARSSPLCFWTAEGRVFAASALPLLERSPATDALFPHAPPHPCAACTGSRS